MSGDTAYGGYYETLFAAGGNAGRPIPLAIRNPLGLIEQKEDVSDVNRFIGNARVTYNTHFLDGLKAVVNVGTDMVNSNGTVLYLTQQLLIFKMVVIKLNMICKNQIN